MQVNVVRVTKFEGKGGFKGFATVDIMLDEESKVTLNSLAIKEWTPKDGGETKLIVTPAQSPPKKDGDKWNDNYKVTGPFWWVVVNAVLDVYNGKAEATGMTPASTGDSPASPANTKRDVVRTEGAAAAAKKPGPKNSNPFV